MCLCVCVRACECWLLNFWEGEPKDRRAVKLLITQGDVGRLFTLGSLSM